MSIHEGFLELAAAALDFELDRDERPELDHHLAGCDACRRTAAAYRDDATAITAGSPPRLPAGRSATILADALRLQKPRSPMRLLAVAALFAVLGGGALMGYLGISRLLEAPAIVVVPSPSASLRPSIGPSADPSLSADPSAVPPVETPIPTQPPIAGSLPIRGSGRAAGTQVRMAPGPDGELYVSIPTSGGSVLTLLDSRGESREGWPVVLPDATSCDHLLPADDGSVRVVCTLENPQGNLFSPIGAFAFDASGRSQPGWPVVLGDHRADGHDAARVVGDQLTLLAWASRGDLIPEGEPSADAWIMKVDADGTVRSGDRIPHGGDSVRPVLWAIGPDGVAYGAASQLYNVAFDSRATWDPSRGIDLDGIASRPAFDAAGRIRLTVAGNAGASAQIVAFEPDGDAAVGAPLELGFRALGTCDGIEGTCAEPAPPLVGADGTTFVIGAEATGTIVVAVQSDYLALLDGWPHRSGDGHQVIETGVLAAPALGPDYTLYRIVTAANDSVGGRIVAIGLDGGVVDGWPVELKRPGSAFWSVVVGSDGIAYALAIEPEPNDGSSATILAIAPDSTVLYTSTIIDP